MRRLLLMTIAAACAALAVPSVAGAASCAYSGAGNWTVAANWNCDGSMIVPGSSDSVTIGAGADVAVSDAQSAGSVVLSGGSLTVGSAATLTIGGSYTQTGGMLKIEVAGTAPGTTSDGWRPAAPATLGGTLTVIQVGGFDPLVTDSFAFLTSGSTTGAFATLDAAPLLLGKRYRLEYPAGPGFGPASPSTRSRRTTRSPAPTAPRRPGSLLSCSTGTWLGDPPPSFGDPMAARRRGDRRRDADDLRARRPRRPARARLPGHRDEHRRRHVTATSAHARHRGDRAPERRAAGRLRQRSARLVLQLRDRIVERLPGPRALRANGCATARSSAAPRAPTTRSRAADAGDRSPAASRRRTPPGPSRATSNALGVAGTFGPPRTPSATSPISRGPRSAARSASRPRAHA